VLADLGADARAELSRYEGLQGDARDDGGDGQVSRPMVNPMASSSRLMLSPSAMSASPRLVMMRAALSSSSLSPASSIHAPMVITAAPAR
jgi:hypothetical protein